MDPLTPAHKAAKAAQVDPGEFRTLNEKTNMLSPPVGRGYQAWKLQEHSARIGKARHDWRPGVRLGPNSSGVYPRRVFDLDAPPAAIRKAGFGGVMKVLRSPGQVGYPPKWDKWDNWASRSRRTSGRG